MTTAFWKPPTTPQLWIVLVFAFVVATFWGSFFGFYDAMILSFFLHGQHRKVTVVWPWQTNEMMTSGSTSACTAR